MGSELQFIAVRMVLSITVLNFRGSLLSLLLLFFFGGGGVNWNARRKSILCSYVFSTKIFFLIFRKCQYCILPRTRKCVTATRDVRRNASKCLPHFRVSAWCIQSVNYKTRRWELGKYWHRVNSMCPRKVYCKSKWNTCKQNVLWSGTH